MAKNDNSRILADSITIVEGISSMVGEETFRRRSIFERFSGWIRKKIVPRQSRAERMLIFGLEGFRMWRSEGYRFPQIGLNAVVQRTMPGSIRKLFLLSTKAKIFFLWMRSLLPGGRPAGNDLEEILKKGQFELSTGHVVEAEKIFHLCLKSFPTSEQASLGLAKIKLARGEFLDAQRILFESLAWNSNSFELQGQLASLLLASGSFWEAEKVLKRMIKQFPDRIEPMINLADIAVSDARFTEATDYYEKILEIDSGNLAAIAGLVERSKQCKRAREIMNCLSPEIRKNDLVGRILAQTYRGQEPAVRLVSIIIPVFNHVNYTRDCVDAIKKNTMHPFELIIVDNGSTDGTASLVEVLKNQAKVIQNATNLGFVEACNQGARLSTGKYLLFLNNDTIPQPGWLSALVEVAEADPAVAIVGAKLVYPDGRLQEAGDIYFKEGIPWNYGKNDNPQRPEYNYLRETSYCSGACLLVRRDIFEKVGRFDSRYSPAYCEDADLAFAVRKLGYKVVYQPKAEVIHYEGITGGMNIEDGLKRNQAINLEKFKDKWKNELQNQPAYDRESVRSASHFGAKKRILMIDHYLPAFDRSGGNHRSFEILRLLREAGNHVTFLARNGEYQKRYKTALEQIGIETIATDPDRLTAWDYKSDAPRIHFAHLLKQSKYSLAIISRYEIAAIYLPILKKYAPDLPVAVDTVDVHFLRETRKAHLYSANKLEASANQIYKNELSVYEQADTLITVSEQDADILRERMGAEKKIWIIPTIHPLKKNPTPFSSRKDLLFTGNFIHPPNSDAVLYFCGQILPIIRSHLPQLRFFIVGGNSMPLLDSLASETVVITGYVPDVSPFLETCRVSVAPLRYGAGMKAKIGEALSHGLPVVTTSIGSEGLSLVNKENAMIADDPKEFADAVIKLYSDESLWESLSQGGRQLVQRYFTPEAVKVNVNKMIESF